ncbi:SubName: Full=Uncharacterized protein {ECO:0000313/EMBL:CCA68090.1} [Serendipita indica DSM 11827]|uniref:Uncharacterized protein n=1 Tax=Serendipita indica (strain DSM 11827) TaxID=1109443 RepID=G4T9T7_SERID|nr:SubName: Full=Uncharacterized protein {ECO:0000313/EMBL:CCA68090.1} [Serendipita indica DSM 11827]CCA68090.1 hypothetical protein PIIN_01958 [Serendipita indica DSM 11827]
MSSVHQHLEGAPAFPPFPEGMNPAAMRARVEFSNHGTETGPIGHPTRHHPNDHNTRWLSRAFRRQSTKDAEYLRTVSAGILRTQWWDENAHFPDAERLFGQLLDREGKCTICGSENGTTCLKHHFAYNPQ